VVGHLGWGKAGEGLVSCGSSSSSNSDRCDDLERSAALWMNPSCLSRAELTAIQNVDIWRILGYSSRHGSAALKDVKVT
jgi:hypothetical protein